ncbi:MAG: phage terminase large subunit [Betaproteobacteria bacterium]
MSSLTMALESGAPLTNDQERQVAMLTRSDAIDTRINTMTAMLEQTEGAYLTKLAAMAPYDLSAYHELLNPHEPPAHHHYYLCDYLMKVEAGELATLIVALPPGAAKSTYSSRTFVQWYMGRNPDNRVLAVGHALALDTEVPTPSGFKTIADLQVGDEVFAHDGSATKVTGKSEVFYNRQCYTARTTEGAEVVVDGEHLWSLEDTSLSKKNGVSVFSTDKLYSLKQNGKRGFRLIEQSAVQFTDKDILVDPYTLGLWLGDGETNGNRIASAVEDISELRSNVPYETRSTKSLHHFSIVGIRDALRRLGVLGSKRIPDNYVKSSIETRVSLIQGLMDSDGSVGKDGYCHFHNTNKQIVDSFREILFSLGIKNSVFEVKIRGVMTKAAWRVHFKFNEAFRLARKAGRCSASAYSRRHISFEKSSSVPTQCITIDHPSKVFLVTRGYIPTHNSQKFTEDEFSKPNRNAVDTDTYRLVFPDVELNPMEQGASFWKLNGWRGSYACRGALAGTSGLRAKIIMADDLFKNAADAMSPVVRENIWRWWTADVMSRRLPGAPVILVNTLWHSEDVPNRFKKLAEDDPESIPQPFKFINIPAQAEQDDPLGRAPGEWLWCSDQQEDGFYSIKDYETKRATMPPSLWSALYLGQPLDKLGDYISEDQFSRYDRPPVNRNGHQIEWTKTIMSIDCAARGADRSDYTAILIFRKHVDGTHYLVDAWRGKETLERVVRIISKLMRFWQVNYAVLEDSGMGIQILDNYQGKLPAPLIAYTPSGKGSKDFRFDAAAPWITAGKVLFPKQGPWIADFINELVAFPNSANDDWVDAFSMYTDHELKARVGGTKPLKMRP